MDLIVQLKTFYRVCRNLCKICHIIVAHVLVIVHSYVHQFMEIDIYLQCIKDGLQFPNRWSYKKCQFCHDFYSIACKYCHKIIYKSEEYRYSCQNLHFSSHYLFNGYGFDLLAY